MRVPSVRAGCVLALAGLAVLASVCSTEPLPPAGGPLPGPQQQRELGWTRVDVPGTVRAVAGLDSGDPPPHLHAAGDDDGAPFLVDVTDGRARSLPDPADGSGWTPPDGGYQAVDGNGDVIALVGRTDPGALLLHAEWSAFPPYRLADGRGREASWVSPLLDGEQDLRVVGAVPADGAWEVHAWQDVGDGAWLALDRGSPLRLATAPSTDTVLTGTTEVSVVVAGDVVDAGGRGGVWSLGDMPELSGGQWRHHPTETVPDRVTDVASWDLGWWVAGHRNGRPVVYDFDEPALGAALPVPDTLLDPQHPLVLVAGVPVGQPMLLATQSEDGPALWADGGAGWQRTPVPAGRLSAAQRVGDGVYVVVDGALWFRDLPPEARQP